QYRPSGETVMPCGPSTSAGITPTGTVPSTTRPCRGVNVNRLTRSDDSFATTMWYAFIAACAAPPSCALAPAADASAAATAAAPHSPCSACLIRRRSFRAVRPPPSRTHTARRAGGCRARHCSRDRRDRLPLSRRRPLDLRPRLAHHPPVQGEEERDRDPPLHEHAADPGRAEQRLAANLPEPPDHEHHRLDHHQPDRPLPPLSDPDVAVRRVDQRLPELPHAVAQHRQREEQSGDHQPDAPHEVLVQERVLVQG